MEEEKFEELSHERSEQNGVNIEWNRTQAIGEGIAADALRFLNELRLCLLTNRCFCSASFSFLRWFFLFQVSEAIMTKVGVRVCTGGVMVVEGEEKGGCLKETSVVLVCSREEIIEDDWL